MLGLDSGCAVLLANITDSTNLYERYRTRGRTASYRGAWPQRPPFAGGHADEIVQTIGDEIMCRFTTADQGVHATRGIHETLAQRRL
jgi:hypothetical protein